jgi:hypothetical protein
MYTITFDTPKDFILYQYLHSHLNIQSYCRYYGRTHTSAHHKDIIKYFEPIWVYTVHEV